LNLKELKEAWEMAANKSVALLAGAAPGILEVARQVVRENKQLLPPFIPLE
jgi:hypothetical protein